MKLLRKVGVTSEIWQVFIQDSSSTTGAGLTGLVFNTASLTAYYHRDTDTTATAITLVTMTVGTFTSSGFKEIDSTNMPGWYQFCPPNAALATGAKSCGFHLKGATNMAPLPIEVDLDGQVDVTHWNGTAVATPATAGIPDVNVKNINNVVAATPGASGGVLISGSNSGTTTLGALTITGATIYTGNVSMDAGLTITQSTTNDHAISVTGNGTGHGLKAQGGTTGHGFNAVGGTTSGDGINSVATTSGHGFICVANGTSKHGIQATGGTGTSHGINAVGGGVGNGITASSGGGASGNGALFQSIATDGEGLKCVGFGSGNGISASSGSGTSGSGIRAKAFSTNGIGLECVGAGTSSGIITTGGITGQGIKVVGGATSGAGIAITTTLGDGISITPTAGHAIVATANGTSKHGIVSTGGTAGTSDGVKCVAGTGGVDLRANITGTLTTVTTVTNQLTAAQIATGVWQDATAGDFTATSSIGKSLYTGDVVPGGTGGHFIAGTNAATTITTALTTTFTGNLTGSVGSVTGNVGGNVTGSVGSVASGGITTTSFAANTGLQTIRSNTAQAGGGATITLDASASGGSDFYTNDLIYLTGGTGVGQARQIISYDNSTKIATVSNWTTPPDNTTTFAILPNDRERGSVTANVTQWNFQPMNNLVLGRVDVSVGEYQSGLAPLQPTVAGRTLDVATTGEAGIDWANIGAPATTVALTGTTVGTVTTLATNAIDRATFAANTGLQTVRSNTAQAGTATSITLDASASSVTDFYKGQSVYLTGGTGTGQTRIVTAYDGATKIATVQRGWATNPDVTSTFAIMSVGGTLLSR